MATTTNQLNTSSGKQPRKFDRFSLGSGSNNKTYSNKPWSWQNSNFN